MDTEHCNLATYSRIYVFLIWLPVFNFDSQISGTKCNHSVRLKKGANTPIASEISDSSSYISIWLVLSTTCIVLSPLAVLTIKSSLIHLLPATMPTTVSSGCVRKASALWNVRSEQSELKTNSLHETRGGSLLLLG